MSEDREHAHRCCSLEFERLKAELDTCDQSFAQPKDWHRCARKIARRSGDRAKRCIRQA